MEDISSIRIFAAKTGTDYTGLVLGVFLSKEGL